jgi:hypothetical protein
MFILKNCEMIMSLAITNNNNADAFKIVSGSYPLFLAAILAMIWANLLAASYHSFWHTQLSLSMRSKPSTLHVQTWRHRRKDWNTIFNHGLPIWSCPYLHWRIPDLL